MIKRTCVAIIFVLTLAACSSGQSAAPISTLTVITEPTASPAQEAAMAEETGIEAPAPTQEVAEQPAETEEDTIVEGAASEPAPTEEVMVADPTAEVIVNTKLNLNQATGDDYLAHRHRCLGVCGGARWGQPAAGSRHSGPGGDPGSDLLSSWL